MAFPVTIVASGGLPVIDMAENGFPVTSVASGGLPVTLVAGYNLGIGVTFVSASGAAVTENIVLTWDGNATDLTPLFTADSVIWTVGDYAEMRWSSSDATLATYTSEQRLITSDSPLTLASDFAYGTGLTAGTWYMQIWDYRGASYVGKSNIETITLTAASNKFLLEGGAFRYLMEGGTSLLITEGS